MALAAWLGTVLAYGTTGRAARRFGAGDRAAAVAEGVQASWLALAAGLAIAVLAQIFAGPLTRALAGGDADGRRRARRSGCGSPRSARPGILLAMAGNGWMRGVQDTRRPLCYVLGANVLSAVLCPLLVYPVGLGLAGSAIANVVAQTVRRAAVRPGAGARAGAAAPAPRRARAASWWSAATCCVRGAAFQACFLSAAAVAARFGAAALGAHQIALQLWMFCALALDAVAIAAQSLVGAALGAGDAPTRPGAARRIAPHRRCVCGRRVRGR